MGRYADWTMTQDEIHLPDGMSVDEARDVLREYHDTDDAQILDQETLSALREEIAEAKEAFAAVLAEESPQSADTLARQDMDALTEPYRNDDGDIDVDTLRQEPETQTSAGGSGNGDDPVDIDTLGRDERELVQKKRQKITTFEERDMDGRVDALKGDIAEIVGADDYEDVEADLEVL